MRTKIEAARIAAAGGAHMVIADGRIAHPIARVAAGGPCTWFLTPSNPLAARKVWIGGSLELKGAVDVDAGAAQALGERQEPAAGRRHAHRGRIRARRLRRHPRRARRRDRPRPDRLRRAARRAHPRPQLARHRAYPGHAGPRGDDPSRRHGAQREVRRCGRGPPLGGSAGPACALRITTRKPRSISASWPFADPRTISRMISAARRAIS